MARVAGRAGIATAPGTPRFRARREAIVTAASALINERSVKGMTFGAVAERAALKPAAIGYYFRRKDELAGAAFDRTLDYFAQSLVAAAREPTPAERIRRFVTLHVERLAAMRIGAAPQLAVLSDVRASAEPERARLLDRWRAVFRLGRSLWGAPADRAASDLFGARAHVMLESAFWLSVWIGRYDADEWTRVQDRLLDIMLHGIAAEGEPWAPASIDALDPIEVAGRPAFLDVATRLINERGPHGASVQRIVADLNVTKGSFYHHLDAKDDLVVDCYDRSFDRVAAVQRAADRRGGSSWTRLSTALAGLVDAQFGRGTPILRTTAMRGLPPDTRRRMLDRSDRIARRFADHISDGGADGSCRPVDAMIAGQALMALQNAAFDMRRWASSMPRHDAVRLYASTLLYGMVDRERG